MVRLSKGYEALLYPYVDSKGNFGKSYSRDMQWAAARYTEAKLAPICAELFGDIDKDTVDFVDNYDSTMKEPTLLPVTFPSVLVNLNSGIAVGMASSICSFNIKEVCETTIELIKNPDHIAADTLLAPDFIGGGQIIYNREDIENIYSTGRGSIKCRAKYVHDKSSNCIDIIEIAPTTTAEAIIDKVIDRVKAGTIKEISDIRDETDKSGLKITIDLKRGTDPDKLMQKLYKMTPLEDTFSCNFNVLIGGMPKVLGVCELLNEWIAFRTECVRRRVFFSFNKNKEKLHLLKGLSKILLDIDKAVRIVRETDEEKEVVPNLMIGFLIDEVQAEYVADIKLRYLNKEYILKRLEDIEKLEAEIADMGDILNSKNRVKNIIIEELSAVVQKYSSKRRSEILYDVELEDDAEQEDIQDYPVTLFFTHSGYFKKITPLSLRMSGEQKLKDGDTMKTVIESSNTKELLFFTDQFKVYKSRVYEFSDTKASVLGDYVPTKLNMDEGENAINLSVLDDYSGYFLFFFENGKAAKINASVYETKTNRKKLIKAYSDKSPIVDIIYINQDCELVLQSSSGRILILNTGALTPKNTKDIIGVGVMSFKKGQKLAGVRKFYDGEFEKPNKYRTKNLPSRGAMPSDDDMKSDQLTLE
jgi:DNA gyrase subunit A